MQKNNVEKLKIGIPEGNVFSEYIVDDKEVLDEVLVDTIEKTANTKPVRKNLDITFVSNQKIDSNRFTSAYKNTMQNKVDTKNREISRCLITGIIMTIVSVCLLLLYVYVFSQLSLFWNKFQEISVWVFVWASVEILTVELIQLMIDRAKAKKLLNATLTIK